MSQLMSTVSVLALLALGSRCAGTDMITLIGLFPFATQTYEPVTRENIEQFANCRVAVALDEPRAAELRRLLTVQTSGGFDNSVVRMKVMGFDVGPLFVDEEGGVWNDRLKRSSKLTEQEFGVLRRLVAELATHEGCEERP